MDLTYLLEPSTIAVIGASNNRSRLGGLVLQNLLAEFPGRVAPVNPKHVEVQGVPAFGSVSALDFEPDLAVVVSPAETVVDTARECVERGVRAMLVISSGFAEAGEKGRELQEALATIAASAGVPLLGPNCVGVLNLNRRMRASFVRLLGIPTKPGPTAVVSQSGAVGLSIFEQAQLSGIGSSYLCTTGNEAGISCADIIGHVLEDDDVNVVLLYMEGIRDPDRLLAVGVRALELGKPIVALKVGGSSAGSRAAVSHTGSMALPDAVVDAALDRVGIIRAASIREMMDYSRAFATARLPNGRRTVILTGSGGTGVMMADAAEREGLDVARPSGKLESSLGVLVPAIGSVVNPIDHTAQVVNQPENYERLVREVAKAAEYDAMVMGNISRTQMPEVLDLIQEVSQHPDLTVVGHSHYPEIVEALTARGVPAADDADAAIHMVAVMIRFAERRCQVMSDDLSKVLAPRKPVPDEARTVVPAAQARTLLRSRGIEFARDVQVTDAEAAVEAWRSIGGPVALKVDGVWMPHKSEHGGLVLGCDSRDDVQAAFERLAALTADQAPAGTPVSVLVQEMAPRGIEIICGGFRDAVFGPMLTVGIGGVLVEIIREQRLCLAPVSYDEAKRLVSSLAEGRLVGSVRGISAAQLDALAHTLTALGDLLVADASVQEVELNPLILDGERVVAVDALVTAARRAS